VARLGVRRSIRTASVSPGSAPSMKKGPVMGLGRLATATSCASRPEASMVSVISVSPSASRRQGSAVPMVLK